MRKLRGFKSFREVSNDNLLKTCACLLQIGKLVAWRGEVRQLVSTQTMCYLRIKEDLPANTAIVSQSCCNPF
jgi:hypothetical protein